MPEPSITTPIEGFETSLSTLLRESFTAHLDVMRTAVGDMPHGPRGFGALQAAAVGEPRNQAELAKQLGLDRTVMVYLIDDLEAAGLVERVPDPGDRRSKLIRATDAGRAKLAEMCATLAVGEAELLADFSPAENELLRSLLHRIVARRPRRYDQGHDCRKDEC